MGERIGDRYELEGVLGTGGMATVYCAFDIVLERKVALKVLHERYASDDEYVARFENEARAAAGLTHPNIVAVMDRGQQDGRRFIVFEYVEGENLKQLVTREGPLPIERVLRIGADVAQALAFAHAGGVVHRDVKPQNVLVDEDRRAKVTDFGIARTDTAGENTETGTILGTGSYFSPEQARGERAGPEADVYALGVVLYELLTGRPPYEGPSFLAVAMRHVRDPVPEVLAARPDCPPALAALVERCLAKAPAERPRADELAPELVAIARGGKAGGEPPPDERTMVISRRPRPAKAGRRRLPLAVAGVLALAAASLAGVLLLTGDESAATAKPVAIDAVATYDPPPGDGMENDGSVPEATDGNPATFWSSEGYGDFESFEKDGVGLVLDVGEPRELASLTVTSDLPGWTAEIRSGNSPSSFSETVAQAREAGTRTTWRLEGGAARYYVIWITAMATDEHGEERAHVNEVTARA